jgi:hypothetical protein
VIVNKNVGLDAEQIDKINQALAQSPDRFKTSSGRPSANEVIRQAVDHFFSCEASVTQDGQ